MTNSWRKGTAAVAAAASLAVGCYAPAAMAVQDGDAGSGSHSETDKDTGASTNRDVRMVTVAGRKVTLEKTDDGWAGKASVASKDDLPKSDDLFDVIVDPQGVPDQYSLKYDAKRSSEYATATDTLGVVHREGVMKFAGTYDGDDTETVLTVVYSYDDGHAANADGHGFTWNEKTRRWETSWRVEWTSGMAPGLTSVTLDDGKSKSTLPVRWKVANTDGVLGATATVTGSFSDDAGDHAYTISLDAVRPAVQSRSVKHAGGLLHLSDQDGVWSGNLPADTTGDSSDEITVVAGEEGKPDRSYTLRADRTGVNATQTGLGTVAWSGSVTYSNDEERTSVSMPVSYEHGNRAKAVYDDHTLEFHRGDDGVWHANVAGTLDLKNKPTVGALNMNGRDVNVVWSDDVKTTTGESTLIRSLSGVATGTIDVDGVQQRWSVDVTAARTEGRVSALTVLQRNADGSTTTHPISGFDPAKGEYSLTLPADAVTASYSLGYSSASDTDKVTEGDPVAPSIDGTTRVLRITLNGATYTVRVAFAKPQQQPSNTAARLKGIYVNYDGTTGKGTLIDGWDPDTLAYTVHVPADAKGVYVLPEAPDGVSVKATDVIQSGYSTTQRWVSSAGGQSRVYQVTVVRDHDEPTADEAFTPGKPKDQDGLTQTENRRETNLVSHGWTDVRGEYHTEDSDSYRIGEGGSFSFASYAGQTVSVATEKISPMNYRYTLSVLAPDGTTFMQHEYTVTYITEATSKAELSGILVNNKPVDGFKPGVLEYTATVGNLDHWTVVPQFDRQSGVSVTTSRDKADAKITVVSADGLSKRVYTVHAKVDPVRNLVDGITGSADSDDTGADGTDGVQLGELSSTGSATWLPAVMSGTLVASGIALLLAASAHLRRRRDAKRGHRPAHGTAL
ncbi:hypothetical protein [Bifidobacterium sp. SO1]|uniref:hypothetical protein n=1 Tax=Bifidobacterium sp. SO1 TaxID=2809029 RepID=UPI001BDD3E49|nr:hypothetical protein [Bifidobacterium sp. SO1]MBT1160935.1 hypothetical protein [Bifidobacterium sp. SO1]